MTERDARIAAVWWLDNWLSEVEGYDEDLIVKGAAFDAPSDCWHVEIAAPSLDGGPWIVEVHRSGECNVYAE